MRVAAGVFEIEEIALGIGNLHMLEAAVLADSMFDMNDEIIGAAARRD